MNYLCEVKSDLLFILSCPTQPPLGPKVYCKQVLWDQKVEIISSQLW